MGAWDAEDKLTGLEEHLRDSQPNGYGRNCPRHPGEITSSRDGQFDAPCGACEWEMDQEL